SRPRALAPRPICSSSYFVVPRREKPSRDEGPARAPLPSRPRLVAPLHAPGRFTAPTCACAGGAARRYARNVVVLGVSMSSSPARRDRPRRLLDLVARRERGDDVAV